MVVVAALMNMGMGTARVGGPPLMYSVIARKGAGAGVEATTEAEGVVRTNGGGGGCGYSEMERWVFHRLGWDPVFAKRFEGVEMGGGGAFFGVWVVGKGPRGGCRCAERERRGSCW